MQPTDLISIHLCALGNLFLRRTTAIDWDERALGVNTPALAAPVPDKSAVEFDDAGRRVFFKPWLEEAARRGLRSLGLTALERMGHRPPRPKQSGQTIPENVLRAFAGTSRILLAAVFPDRVDAWAPHIVFPRASDLDLQDIVQFIAASPAAGILRELMQWENENNLHFYPGKDWPGLIQAVGPLQVEKFVEAFNHSVWNARVPRTETRRWTELYSPHRKNDPWDYIFAPHGSGQRESLPRGPLGAQAGRLGAALEAAALFATAQKETDWAKYFQEGEKLLTGFYPAAEHDFIGALRGLDVPAESLRLVAGAVHTLEAFGGMGTWNDTPAARTSGFQQVSDPLIHEADLSLMMAANSWMEAPPA